MKRYYSVFIFIMLFQAAFFSARAQNLTLAKSYLKDGEYDKAYPIFMEWYQKRNFRHDVYQALLEIYQYKGQFDQARKLSLEAYAKYKNAVFLADAYHAAKRSKNEAEAGKILNKINIILQTRRGDFLPVARRFKKYGYFPEALEILNRYAHINPGMAYLDMAEIYAEQGQLHQMMDAFVKATATKPFYFRYVTANLSKYVTSNPANRYNRSLKEVLIEKIAQNPLPVYLQLLQWLYVREKNFKRAFVQAKGLFLRGETDQNDLFYLAQETFNNGDYETASEIVRFLKSGQKSGIQPDQRIQVLETRIERETNRHSPEKLQALVPVWKKRAAQIRNRKFMQDIYREIVDVYFQLKQYDTAGKFLDSLIRTTPAGRYQAEWKEKQGDLLLLRKEFDQAAIQFTLLKEENPYTETGYRAVYKIGLASFLGGDFDWAHRTLKTLKKAASRKIANDALLLDFMIISNRNPGDTVQAGLHAFSKLYYDYFAGNYKAVLQKGDSLKSAFKGQKIYDDILYLQAMSAEKTAQFDKAIQYWNEILAFQTENTLHEEALYHLGIIFAKEKKDIPKAREYFKRILLEYPQGFRRDQASEYYEKLKNPEL